MRGRSTLLTALVLGGLAHAEAKEAVISVSGNGTYSLKASEVADGSCHVEVSQESQVAWALDKCLGTPSDLYFISNDGGRVWVLKSTPEKPARPKAGGKKEMVPWAAVPVAVLYDKEGKIVASRRLLDLVPAKSREKVIQLEHHFKWLEGVAGVPGKGPRVTDLGVVELESVGGKTYRLPFSG